MSTTTHDTIRSKYSDQQLTDALITATEATGNIFIRGNTSNGGSFSGTPTTQAINGLHAILHVLDTLTQDSTDAAEGQWQRAQSFQDIRPGDMLKVEVEGLVGYYKYAVNSLRPNDLQIIFDNGDIYQWSYEDAVSRIPAPIVHPDPTENRLIIVHEFDGKLAPEGSYASICQNLHGDPIYEYVPGDGSQTMATTGAGITSWSPAKVVADND